MPIPPVAIVTGAGSGIGRATCELLADAGFRLTLAGRTEISLLRTVELLAEEIVHAPETLIVPADVADRQQAESIVDLTLERWGRIDAMVNNAGILAVRPIDQVDADVLYQLFAANTFGPAYLVARCWPTFVRQAAGCVVNISSMASVDPFNGLSAYAASKAALESLTRSVVNEGKAHGIRAFSIAPGAVETNMLRSAYPESVLPSSATLDPIEIAQVIVQCVRGERDHELGKSILVRSR